MESPRSNTSVALAVPPIQGTVQVQGTRSGFDARVGLMAVVGLALAGVSVAIAAGGSGSKPALAVLNGLSVAVPIGVGLYLWPREESKRLGSLMVALGVVYFVVSLSASRDELVYSVGRVAAFGASALVVYVILAFPRGRLETAAARVIFVAVAVDLAVLYLPLVPLVRFFPHPFPWGGCNATCPPNAFFAGHQPAFVGAVRSLGELIGVVFFAAAVVLIGLTIRSASRLRRRTLLPVLVASALWLVALIALFVGRRVGGDDDVTDVASWTVLASIPLIALGMLLGVLQWRLYVAAALPGLIRRLSAHPEPLDLRRALADALEDPSLEIAYWIPSTHGYADADGRAVLLPEGDPARAVTPIASAGERVAAIVHDPALQERPELVEAAAATAMLMLDRDRLNIELRASLAELRATQTRILSAADGERKRIERDLHDGAQQRLIALRIKLSLISELMERGSPRALELQHRLADDVDAALEEIRGLAQGIYPPLLASHGLSDALDAVAAASSVPTRVRVSDHRRFAPESESAVYFCCREALQNVAKHAESATGASIDVSSHDGMLTFAVADDGAGFEPARTGRGNGLINMRDRLTVVGGELDVRSHPGTGTVVSGAIPLGLT